MIKTIVIICSIISILCVGVFYFVIALRNTGTNDIVTPTVQITAAIVAGVVFFAVSSLSTEDKFDSATEMSSIFHNSGEFLSYSKDLDIVNSKKGWGYDYLGYTSKLVSSEDSKARIFEGDSIHPNQIVQAAFLVWLGMKNPQHWNSTHKWRKGNGRSSMTFEQNLENNYENSQFKIIDHLTQIQERFGNYEALNISKKIPPSGISENISLPKGSEIEISEGNILIKNGRFTLEISFSSSWGNNGIGFTKIGQTIEKELHDRTQWNSVDTDVTFKAIFNRWTKNSKETVAIKNWIKKMTTDFERDFGFDGLKEDLENSLNSMNSMNSNWVMVTPSKGYKK